MVAGLIIKFTHNKEDDPAGFLAICIVTTFVSIVVEVLAKEILSNHINGKIPEHIYNVLSSCLLMFCTELEIDNGKIDSESFQKMIDTYSTFDKYGIN